MLYVIVFFPFEVVWSFKNEKYVGVWLIRDSKISFCLFKLRLAESSNYLWLTKLLSYISSEPKRLYRLVILFLLLLIVFKNIY